MPGVANSAGRVRRRAHSAWRRLRGEALKISLRCANRWSKRPVTGDADAIVSLTTYAPRFRSVDLTIESIARGRARARRVILWLDDPSLVASPTRPLARLMARGLEVRQCHDWGPHKKYFPALGVALDAGVQRLVTADDDVMYPRGWLADLIRVGDNYSEDVAGHRVRVAQVSATGLAPWSQWPECRGTYASFLNIAIGEAGVSYPRTVLEALRERGDAFLDVAPRADDLWLHVTALRIGVKTRQVRSRSRYPLTIPGAQRVALSHSNIDGGQNDAQIRSAYGSRELELLAAEASVVP